MWCQGEEGIQFESWADGVVREVRKESQGNLGLGTGRMLLMEEG